MRWNTCEYRCGFCSSSISRSPVTMTMTSPLEGDAGCASSVEIRWATLVNGREVSFSIIALAPCTWEVSNVSIECSRWLGPCHVTRSHCTYIEIAQLRSVLIKLLVVKVGELFLLAAVFFKLSLLFHIKTYEPILGNQLVRTVIEEWKHRTSIDRVKTRPLVRHYSPDIVSVPLIWFNIKEKSKFCWRSKPPIR